VALPTEPVDKLRVGTDEQQSLDRATLSNNNGRRFVWERQWTACVTVKTVLIGLLDGLLLAWGWRNCRRRIERWLRGFQEQLPRRWYPKTPEACPHCWDGAPVTIRKVKRAVVPYCQVKSRRGKPTRVKTAGHACPTPSCVYFGIRDEAVHALVGYGKDGPHGIQRFRCQACKTTFNCRRGSALYSLKTDEARIEMALWFLAEGIDLAVMVRYSGHAEATLIRWLKRAEQHSAAWHRASFTSLAIAVVQMDELYARVRGVGGRWLWVAIDPVSKAILAFHVGWRCAVDAYMLVHVVVMRLAPGTVPVFLTDGLRAYFDALTAHFGQWNRPPGARKDHWQVDEGLQYGQLVKRRERRHVVQTTTRMICGQRRHLVQRLRAAGLSGLIQTYAIERLNLTLRQGVALLTRRTWWLAQSELHLAQHVGWWQAYYHLVRPHQALRLPVPGLRRRFRPRNPAMALGLSDHLWSVGEFLRTPLPTLT
jgi:transposase-like protein